MGEAIKARRAAAGWPQWKLGAAVGVDSAVISRWETGDVEPRQDAVEKLEDALGLPRGQLRVDAGQVSASAAAGTLLGTDSFSIDRDVVKDLTPAQLRRRLAAVRRVLDQLEHEVETDG